MSAQVNDFDKYVDGILKTVFKDQMFIKGLTNLLIALYAAKIAPELPSQVLKVFDNQYFKLFVFSLIIWTSQFSPSTSLLIAIAFMVSVNLANNKPYWEFLENVENTSAPMSPSKDLAISAVSDSVERQMTEPPVINDIKQEKNTILIQPSIIETPNGPSVINPTVVVAPAIVEGPNGEKVMIKPDITVVEPKSEQPQPMSMETQAPLAILSEQPSVEQPKVEQPKVEQAKAEQGCYPARQYDMSKVSGFESNQLAEL